MNHIEKIEQAFVAYLQALPANTFTDGTLILPGENNIVKDDTLIVAYVEGGEMGEEDPPISGNRWANVLIELRTPVSILTKTDRAKGVPEPLLAHQANATALEAALLSASLPEGLTDQVRAFTCLGIQNRSPINEQDENYWMSGYKINLLSCPSFIPN